MKKICHKTKRFVTKWNWMRYFKIRYKYLDSSLFEIEHCCLQWTLEFNIVIQLSMTFSKMVVPIILRLFFIVLTCCYLWGLLRKKFPLVMAMTMLFSFEFWQSFIWLWRTLQPASMLPIFEIFNNKLNEYEIMGFWIMG